MATALIRPRILYAWKGSSLLIVDPAGTCGADPLSGYYFREARFLQSLRLEINGRQPWLCECAAVAPDALAFTYAFPELTEFGGGGTGQSGDETSTDERGIPHRALAIRVAYAIDHGRLHVAATIANHSRQRVACDVRWVLGADFADIQEAHANQRQQTGGVRIERGTSSLRFTYEHAQLPYSAHVEAFGAAWRASDSALETHVVFDAQQSVTLGLRVRAADGREDLDDAAVAERARRVARWRDAFTRVQIPQNALAERIVDANIGDMASFPLLEGPDDEWLALQAGMPLYPALFGRDTLTAGWQAAFLDGGESLEASLTALGRLQSDRVDDWRDEEPGRIPYQMRRGPLARLNLNPYTAYYADFASPLMFVISLGHLYSWTGEMTTLDRHWDTARRILEWARTYGDRDGDGYLEYLTRSSKGTKNQGWKDSGDAIVYDDGRPVPPPIATCELQGYWFAAQQLMAVMSWMRGERDDAREYWRSALALKERFNRDWWVEEEGCIALAMDPDKGLVRAVTSNVGHALATGIIDAARVPAVVGRLFAPDMFSGWGVRTLSSRHASYNPLGYHLGTVWAVEQATMAFGLRRFGFNSRALDVAEAMFDLAQLYPDFRIPECVGGFPRGETPTPGAYPRANTPQLWNASAFPLLLHTILGLQPVAPLHLLAVDPVLPEWMPEVVLRGLRLGGATATIRFWRDRHGASHAEVLHKNGTLRLVEQPPPESLTATTYDRVAAIFDTFRH
jgi:glycogen debranching enzyme